MTLKPISPAPTLSFSSDFDSPPLASSAPLLVIRGASNVSQTANPILGGLPSSAEAPSSSGVTLSPPTSLERLSRIAESQAILVDRSKSAVQASSSWAAVVCKDVPEEGSNPGISRGAASLLRTGNPSPGMDETEFDFKDAKKTALGPGEEEWGTFCAQGHAESISVSSMDDVETEPVSLAPSDRGEAPRIESAQAFCHPVLEGHCSDQLVTVYAPLLPDEDLLIVDPLG
ncbi:hypothetical protein Nepgr_016486 [Nepenthes gracilis]|uniref:Uncharacterized protein n=1 Tax=Nepenthes gracilis TaxID=150966 RepID=A0AAD3SMS0_NEPGR|nr:hypothetical protein Nepgr_016486 [Nepenthes gracilis]